MTAWLTNFTQRMQETFSSRVRFIGIQGSYGRGEATADSDIDVVVVLDAFSYEDLKAYDRALADMDQRKKICGFVSGCQELMHWDDADLFQFVHDTVPLAGSLDWLKPLIGRDSVRRAVHTGACNIYHACVHNGIHEKDPAMLRGLYKSAAFVLQAKHYHETDTYIRLKSELAPRLSGMDARVLRQCMDSRLDFDDASRLLMEWSGDLIVGYSQR